jgi:surface polysaccharide O-acyltransferase-like enzyme
MLKQTTDAAKALAIMAVVAIHLIGILYSFFPAQSPAWNVLFVLNLASRFSVPLFVALSGLAFGIKYAGGKIDIKEFYTKRAIKILPLYLFWSGVIYLVVHIIPGWSGYADSSPWWQLIFLGRTDYHLYFVPMIFQLYLLFPLFLYLTRRLSQWFLMFTFLVQVTTQVITKYLGWGDQGQYLFFGTWIFYFVLGIYLSGENVIAGIASWARRVTIPVMVFGLVWLVVSSFGLVASGQDVIDITRFTRFPVIVYSLGVMMAIFIWGDRIIGVLGKLGQGLSTIGKQSYLIYLCHTIILKILFAFIMGGQDIIRLAEATLVVLAAIILPGAVSRSKIWSTAKSPESRH